MNIDSNTYDKKRTIPNADSSREVDGEIDLYHSGYAVVKNNTVMGLYKYYEVAGENLDGGCIVPYKLCKQYGYKDKL